MKYRTKNTERNRRIIEHLRAGVKTSVIAAQEGTTVKNVLQVKFLANRDGAGLPNMLPLRGEDNISVWFRLIEDGQEYSADDELYDDDEPYGPIQRCRCGLVVPCNSCLSLAEYTNPVTSPVWDNFPIVPYGHSSALMLQGKTGKSRHTTGGA